MAAGAQSGGLCRNLSGDDRGLCWGVCSGDGKYGGISSLFFSSQSSALCSEQGKGSVNILTALKGSQRFKLLLSVETSRDKQVIIHFCFIVLFQILLSSKYSKISDVSCTVSTTDDLDT